MTALAQRNFAGGEIAPSEYARTDLVKFATGLRTLLNFIIQRHGGAKNKPGTTQITEVDVSAKIHRQLPYNRDNETTFNLLFGDLSLRFIKNGAQLNEATQAASDAIKAPQIVVTVTGHSFVIGDEVHASDFKGMVDLNGRNFLISNTTTNTVDLSFLNGTAIDSSNFGVYTAGSGNLAKVFELVTPYTSSQLAALSFNQSIDVLEITTNDHAPALLTRITDTNWTLVDNPFVPDTQFPNDVLGTVGVGGGDIFRYKVTTLDPGDNKTESIPGLETVQTIVDIDEADPVNVEVTGHGFDSGNTVELNTLGSGNGSDELNERRFIIDVVDPNNFTLRDEDGTGNTPYVSGGKAGREEVVIPSAGIPTVANPHVITWTAVAGVTEYFIYKEKDGVYGFIGASQALTFSDDNIDPILNQTPPSFRNPFIDPDSFPAVATIHQERKLYANFLKDTEAVEGSRTGKYTNFTRRSPLQDDDALQFRTSGPKTNGVRAMIDLNGQLIILTQNGEWTTKGGANGALTPTEVFPTQQTHNGSSALQPIAVNGTLLYVQGRQSIVRDLRSEFEINGYKGDDLTVHSSHLFDNFTVVAWAYQQIPHSIVWLVRNDGTLLGLTYVREQQMLAWHRHELEGGFVEDVISIPEGNEDILYLIVRREIDITGTGTKETVRYVERMNSHKATNIKDWVFLDSSKTIDGRNTDLTHTMTITGGTNWDEEELLTLISSDDFFLDPDFIGNDIQLEGTFDFTHPDTGKVLQKPITIRMKIESVTSGFIAMARPDAPIPVSLQGVAITDWAHAIKIVPNLWHLEGEEVSVFADADVVGSVHNKHYEDKFTVEDGKIELDQPYAVIHVGLPITSDLETLDIDTVSGETMHDKKELVTNVTAYVNQSRTFWVGPKEPPNFDNDPLEGLTETIIGDLEKIDKPVPLTTGTIDVSLKGRYTKNGRVFFRHVDPLPLEILAVIARGNFPLVR